MSFKELAEKGIIKIGELIPDNDELIVKNNRRLRELNISPLNAFRLLDLIVLYHLNSAKV